MSSSLGWGLEALPQPLPALNFTLLRAEIIMSCPIRGFRPLRPARASTEKRHALTPGQEDPPWHEGR
jgi:hypothetical protein